MGDTVCANPLNFHVAIKFATSPAAYGVENSVSLKDKNSDEVLAALKEMVTAER